MKNHTHDHDFPWQTFCAALAFLCAGHWLATTGLEMLEHTIPQLVEWPLLLAAVSAAVLVPASVWVRSLHHRHPRPKGWWQPLQQFVLAVVVLLSAFYLAVSVEHFLTHGPLHLANHPVLFMVFSLLMLAGAGTWFRQMQAKTERPRDIGPLSQPATETTPPLSRRLFTWLNRIPAAPEPIQALVLSLSTPNQKFTVGGEIAGCAVVHFQESGDRVLKGRGFLEEDIAELSRELKGRDFWNWQQLLRALRGHTELKHVIVLGSVGTRGSFQHTAAACALIAKYLPANSTVVPHPEPLDFTNFNQLVTALKGIIHGDFKHFQRSKIAVDVTGGQATASVAGAATTMNLECLFQYVDTNLPNDTLTYDVVHEGAPHLH